MSKFDISESLLRKLSKLIEEVGLTEIEFEEDGRRLRLTKQPPQAIVHPVTVQEAPSAPVASPPPGAASAGAAPLNTPSQIDGFVVESQMVGTAYARPEPDKEKFISVGDKVTKGQTLLIIEAMKFMNQVPAPQSGVVKEILFTDGEPVEFGQPLVILGD